jgi:hypothetical protein
MPSSPSPRAVRAPRSALVRRSLRVLALTAVALPLVALAPTPAGVPGVAVASEPDPIVRVVAVVDGMSLYQGVTTAATVAEALVALGVERRPLDRVEPGLEAPVGAQTVIRISRVELLEQRVEVELPRELVRIEDPTLLRGTMRVERTGRTGTRVDTVLSLIVDGQMESRLVVASEVLREPRSRIERVGSRTLDGETVWDALARCEAGGRWDAVRMISGRIAYSGGLQFAPRTWSAFRLEGFPELAHEATREQQIAVGERVLARQGWGAWPACARRLGLR